MIRAFPSSPAPIRISEARPTWPEVSSDGGRQLVRQVRQTQAFPLRRMRLDYEPIKRFEVEKLRQFFQDVDGRGEMFHFVDPATHETYHARFAQDRIGWRQLRAFDYATALLIEEVPIAFAPTHLDGCKAWYDAGRMGLADGASVAQWNDLSGVGAHLTQATAAKRPVFKTSVLNGRPTVRGDGIDDVLQSAEFDAALPQPNTILMVARLSSGTGWLLDGGTNGRHALLPSGGFWAIDSGALLVSTSAVTSAFRVFLAVYDGQESLLRVDGTQVVGGNASGLSLAALTILADRDGGNPAAADVAELAAWDIRISPDEMRMVEHWAGGKYGIAVAG